MKEFREDINLMRALAVLGVLLFHFHVPGFDGGYAGVDVFFVISGYLMTQILLRGRPVGTFYFDRVRRLMPALVVVVLSLLAFGLLLDPITYQRLAREALHALTFTSNFYYVDQGSYFGNEVYENWLLHNWSLAVEWQFYLLYPLALAVLARLNRALIGPALIAGFIGSLALAVAAPIWREWATPYAFYMLPTRVWELLAGGLVVVYGRSMNSRPLHWAGVAVIVASFVLFDSLLPWPSFWALIPVGGTVMVLLANWRAPYLREVGQASYSTYLWHWPIVTACAYFGVRLSGWSGLLAVGASLVIGSLSYRLIETRLANAVFRSKSWLKAAALVAPTLAAAAVVMQFGGLEAMRLNRLPESEQQAVLGYRLARDDWGYNEMCRSNPCQAEGADVLVIGDSHAQQYAPRYEGERVAFFTAVGCPPLPGIDRTTSGFNCPPRVKAAFDLAASGRFRRVVLIASWSGYFEPQIGPSRVCGTPGCDAPETAEEMDELRRKAFSALEAEIARVRPHAEVVIFLPTPTDERADPERLYRTALRGERPDSSFPAAAFLERTRRERDLLIAIGQRTGAEIVDPVSYLCTSVCPVLSGGGALYKDATHFRSGAVRDERFRFIDRHLIG